MDARRAVFGTAVMTLLIAITVPKDLLAQLLPRTRSSGQVVFYQEDPGGTVAVVEQQFDAKTARRLYIQGVSNSGDTMSFHMRSSPADCQWPRRSATSMPRSVALKPASAVRPWLAVSRAM